LQPNINKKLNAYLRSCRIQSKVPQSFLAKHCKYKNSQLISNLERGLSAPTAAALAKYIRFCGADLNKVLQMQTEFLKRKLKKEGA
jgi:transcriptional regulator with XRE-family HTH domain